MTANSDTASPRGADPDARAVDAAGGFERLLPFDGLFLRAEHLDRIQDYTATLVRAVGSALGRGVTAGLGVTVKGHDLIVAPGSAIDGAGRVLRIDRPATLDLADLERVTDRYWVVEAVASARSVGHAMVVGGLCDGGCGSRTSQPITRVDGVVLRVIPATQQGLTAAEADHRSWLAAKLFAREDSDARRWAGPDNDPETLAGQSWRPPALTEGTSDAVPLAILLPIEASKSTERWEVDEWVARRELGDAAAGRAWQWRLGQRPRDVFLAQVLQWQVLFDVRRASAKIGAAEDADTLAALGFVDLPPAGFLPAGTEHLDQAPETVALQLLSGVGLDLGVCHGRVEDVAEAMATAQHRPRTRLDGGGDRRQPVDVIVPRDTPDGARRDWVAFVRRSELECNSGGTKDGNIPPSPDPTFLSRQTDLPGPVAPAATPSETTPRSAAWDADAGPSDAGAPVGDRAQATTEPSVALPRDTADLLVVQLADRLRGEVPDAVRDEVANALAAPLSVAVAAMISAANDALRTGMASSSAVARPAGEVDAVAPPADQQLPTVTGTQPPAGTAPSGAEAPGETDTSPHRRAAAARPTAGKRTGAMAPAAKSTAAKGAAAKATAAKRRPQ